MEIDPGSVGAALAGIKAASAGADVVKELLIRALGPGADRFGQRWSRDTERNTTKILLKAIAKTSDRTDPAWTVHPRIIKAVFDDGQYVDDELFGSYYGGVLASARTGIDRDDRTSAYARMLGRLSVYQVRAHFLFYRELRNRFVDQSINLGENVGRGLTTLFIPFETFADAMELEENESRGDLIADAYMGLTRESLIGGRSQYGPAAGMWNRPDANLPNGILVEPSAIGAQFYLSANSLGSVRFSNFFNEDVVFPLVPEEDAIPHLAGALNEADIVKPWNDEQRRMLGYPDEEHSR